MRKGNWCLIWISNFPTRGSTSRSLRVSRNTTWTYWTRSRSAEGVKSSSWAEMTLRTRTRRNSLTWPSETRSICPRFLTNLIWALPKKAGAQPRKTPICPSLRELGPPVAAIRAHNCKSCLGVLIWTKRLRVIMMIKVIITANPSKAGALHIRGGSDRRVPPPVPRKNRPNWAITSGRTRRVQRKSLRSTEWGRR